MPDDAFKPEFETDRHHECKLSELRARHPDSIGEIVYEIIFRGCNYTVYRSRKGVYVHFSDDGKERQAQLRAYSLICGQICELRYLTAQMQEGLLSEFQFPHRRERPQNHLCDHSVPLYHFNIAQALMLLMESVAQQNVNEEKAANDMKKRAEDIANRALDMAVRRVTIDNTIRYVLSCVFFGLLWISIGLLSIFFGGDPVRIYSVASITGVAGAIFSVIARAQAFELKPCDDSKLNKFMGMVRVGIGGIAGVVLLSLLTATGFQLSQSLGGGGDKKSILMVAIVGFVSGFAERLVPNLVRSTADKIESRAGTPVQAALNRP